jgi:hypothetical protein
VKWKRWWNWSSTKRYGKMYTFTKIEFVWPRTIFHFKGKALTLKDFEKLNGGSRIYLFYFATINKRNSTKRKWAFNYDLNKWITQR